ncbi:MAG TPA: hypothetical protein V6C89_15085 [Drouetiella sp.]
MKDITNCVKFEKNTASKEVQSTGEHTPFQSCIDQTWGKQGRSGHASRSHDEAPKQEKDLNSLLMTNPYDQLSSGAKF